MAFSPDFLTVTVVCTAVNLVVNIGFWTVFWRRMASPEVQLWCVGLMLNLIGSIMLMMLDREPNLFFGLIGGALQIVYPGFMLLGFQAFFKRKLDWIYVWTVPVFYIVTIYPFLGTSLGMKIGSVEMFGSLALASMLICREILEENRRGGLLSGRLAVSVYGSFAVLQVVCVMLGLLFPIVRTETGIQSSWVGWAMLVIVLHKGMCALVIVVLSSDRIESQLRMLADTDMLTGIQNRRSFVSQAEQLLINPPQTMMLAIFDLDHFKRVNDTYGHLAGDNVLKVFSQHVADQLTPAMRFARLGGEEFALFAPVNQPSLSLAFLERLRESVSELEFDFGSDDIQIRMSIGVSFSHLSGNNLDTMMAAADIALYTAKREGRNRVCEFHPSQRLTQFVEETELSRSVIKRQA